FGRTVAEWGQWRPTRGARGLLGEARATVRVLHPGDDPDVSATAPRQPQPERGGNSAGVGGEPLPLHWLPAHHRGSPLRGEKNERAQALKERIFRSSAAYSAPSAVFSPERFLAGRGWLAIARCVSDEERHGL